MNNTSYAISYRDVLLASGFAAKEHRNPRLQWHMGSFFKKLDDCSIIVIDIYNDHWKVEHYVEGRSINHDRLDPIVMDSLDHESIESVNKDTNKNSYLQLLKLQQRLGVDLGLIPIHE